MAATGELVRWGVLGCAGIAVKTCLGIAESGNARVVAVASRSAEKAEAFAKQSAPGAKCYSDYAALLEDESVQVVYIPLPTLMRKEWVLKAAAKRKHVLCEKPIATTLEDTREILAACQAAGVQFMDNTMFMHHDRLAAMRSVLDKKEVFGEIKHVISCFTIPYGNDPEWAKANIRMSATTEPLGTLGDLGWYCIRTSLWAFSWEEPTDVCCHFTEQTDDGVPVTLHALIRWPNGRSASFDSSFKCALRQWAEVVGHSCTLTWDDLVVTQHKTKASFTVSRGTIVDSGVTFPKDMSETHQVEDCVQHARLVACMSQLAARGAPDDFWPKVSLLTQRVLLALYDSGRRGGEWVKVPP